MEDRVIKIYPKTSKAIALRVIPGHFATNHSHINYYLDMTMLKSNHAEAQEVAKTMMKQYVNNTFVDTIICLDGCEVIGAFLAEELAKPGFLSINSGKSINIVTPEYNSNSQMIFRDNIQPMVKEKNVILLLASATTGKTIKRSIECIEYYSGKIQGISAIFSAVDSINDIQIDSIFKTSDIPTYKTYEYKVCPYCKKGYPLDALVNGYGYSKI